MKRIGKAEEVASIASFLAQQDYLTGQVITIDDWYDNAIMIALS